ncbi:hypothetical protein FACS18942_08210 [Planctomycetales bacterium]|nr:hypothetical protein FACS18942_08210 [Planctomycetales bacterium]
MRNGVFNIEIIGTERPAVRPKVAMVDLDGTVSTVRGGWQHILMKLEWDVLIETPQGKTMPQAELTALMKRAIEVQIGKQTIYQALALVELVKQLGGTPPDADEFHRQYIDELGKMVAPRWKLLENGGNPEELTVKGTHKFLAMLRKQGLTLYLVSGTEDEIVKRDAELLRVKEFFNGGIFGGLPQPGAFSKEKMTQQILAEQHIAGEELLGVGDGHTETQCIKNAGGFAVGVASDEVNPCGNLDEWKREQLIRAGADWLIPDYSDTGKLESALFF